MEKPGAVDPAGVRSILASAGLAAQKNLAIVAGTHRRHAQEYVEVMKRVHDGDIGEILAAQCHWHEGATDWHLNERQPEWTDMEWQIRNWPYFVWLSGDHICEQHVHNLDIINWALQSHPVKCRAIGGRQARMAQKYGNIYDHFSTDFEYPNGVRVLSMCSQINGTSVHLEERIVGTLGVAQGSGVIRGAKPFQYGGPSSDPFIQEHADLVTSIRRGKPLNEGRAIAESTMTGIMGRMSAYTGRALSWDWVMKASKLELKPPQYEWGDLPVSPVAVPGKAELT